MGNNIYQLSRFWFPEPCLPAAKQGDCIVPLKLDPDQLFTVDVYFTEKKPGRGQDRNEVKIWSKVYGFSFRC